MEKFYYSGIICIIYELVHLFFFNDSNSIQSKQNESLLKLISSRWIEVLFGIFYISWIITGVIFCITQRQLFIGLLASTLIFPFIISSIPDFKKQIRISQFSNILSLILIGLIEHSYFL